MSKTKKVFIYAGRVLLLAVISLVIGVKLYSWNAKTLAGNEMPMPFGWGISVVLSESMEPALSVNDLVLVRAASDYEVNDVVVYQEGSSLVIHRIRAIDGDEVITKGDANDKADDPIPLSAVKGKAVAVLPFVGVVARFLKKPVGTVLLLLAAVASFEVPYLRQRRKANEEQEKIKEEIRKLKGE